MRYNNIIDFATGLEYNPVEVPRAEPQFFIIEPHEKKEPKAPKKYPNTDEGMLEWFKDTQEDYWQMKTESYPEAWKELCCAVVEAAIKDYIKEYHDLRRNKIEHDEAVWMLKPRYFKFFMESPFCAYVFPDMDGEDMYYNLVAQLKYDERYHK